MLTLPVLMQKLFFSSVYISVYISWELCQQHATARIIHTRRFEFIYFYISISILKFLESQRSLTDAHFTPVKIYLFGH